MQPFRPASSGHEPSGELVHDDHLAALHDVILVAPVKVLSAQCLFQVAHQARLFRGHILRAVRVAQRLVEDLLNMRFTDLGERNLAVFFIDFVILGIEDTHHLEHALVSFTLIRGRAGDDERGTRLIDEDVVHFIDDGVIMPALHPFSQAHRQVVAQVIKPELAICSVHDISVVGFVTVHKVQEVEIFT